MKELFAHIVTRLTPFYPPEEARELAYWVIEETTGMNRFAVHAGGVSVSIPDLEIILQKLCQYIPVQYIFGHAQWLELDLQLTPATLIPRPETAELVQLIAGRPVSRLSDAPVRVLDIGTGSGCIALALKQRHPEWQVTGLDILARAVAVAEANARRNRLDVQFLQADIFSSGLPAVLHDGKLFDLVVSNPPYIRPSERATMTENTLRYEPREALFVPEDDPLLFYRRIAELHWAPELWFEISETQGEATLMLMQQIGYEAECLNDSYGKARFVHAAKLR